METNHSTLHQNIYSTDFFLSYYRYKTHNLHQIMITHGTNKPANLHTFLYPLYEELVDLSENGIEVKIGDDIIRARIHLLTFAGDIPAVADLINHKGHTHHYGCRMCSVKGVRGSPAGMFFPQPTRHCKLYTIEDYRQVSPTPQVRKKTFMVM